MISDVLSEAEFSINDYLREDIYGGPNDPVQQAIVHLKEHMTAVRLLPGLDSPPGDATGPLREIAKKFGGVDKLDQNSPV